MEWGSWAGFVAVALVATATPGPAVLLVTTRCLQSGLGRALVTGLGNVTGLLLMSLAAVVGVSAVIIYSGFAFTVIKLIGAGYLIYMGIRLWRGGSGGESPEVNPVEAGPAKAYLEGVIVAVTNPKAILFTTALFPQFINPAEPLLLQFMLLVSTLMALSLSCLACYAIAAHRLRRRLGVVRGLRQLLGSIYVFAGAAMAATTR